jgi:hypothetical protein
MWPHRSHIVSPLTANTGAPKKGVKPPAFQWTPDTQKAFDQMKASMAADILCAYPDHNTLFHIFTDASDYQLGACIMQNSKTVAFYSKKLNSAQLNYTTIDKELLSVVATLQKFRSMLLGAELHVHTDHKHILSIGDSSQRRLRWISYVDEYGPELHYVEGPLNVIADTFSRLSRNDVSSPLVGKNAANIVSNSESDNEYDALYLPLLDDREILDCLLNLPCISSNKKRKKKNDKKARTLVTQYNQNHCQHNVTVEQCYLNLPKNMVEDNPLDLENIKERQDKDDRLTQSTVKHPTWYSSKIIKDVEDIPCYIKRGDNEANWRNALPKDLILPTIKWYHQVTGHPGSKRLYRQLSQRYYHKDLRQIVDHLNCDFYQRNKFDGTGFGFLPEREVRSIPFEECAVDLIEPRTVQVRGIP